MRCVSRRGDEFARYYFEHGMTMYHWGLRDPETNSTHRCDTSVNSTQTLFLKFLFLLYFDTGATRVHTTGRTREWLFDIYFLLIFFALLGHSLHCEYSADDTAHTKTLAWTREWLLQGLDSFQRFWGYASKVTSVPTHHAPPHLGRLLSECGILAVE